MSRSGENLAASLCSAGTSAVECAISRCTVGACPTTAPSASTRVFRMLADTFCRCVPMTSTMSSDTKRHGRWWSVTLKLSCSFFSSDESSTIEVLCVTVRYAEKLVKNRYAITSVESSEMAPPEIVASVRSMGTLR